MPLGEVFCRAMVVIDDEDVEDDDDLPQVMCGNVREIFFKDLAKTC